MMWARLVLDAEPSSEVSERTRRARQPCVSIATGGARADRVVAARWNLPAMLSGDIDRTPGPSWIT